MWYFINGTRCSASNTTIGPNETKQIEFTVESGYILNSGNITVTGATKGEFTNNTLTISNPTDNVTISATARVDSSLKFTANTASVIKFEIIGTLTTVPTISYYINNGSLLPYTFGTDISLAQGDFVRFKGNNSSWSKDYANYIHFVISSGSIAASGNIMSLLDETCTSTTIPTSYCFWMLFDGCTGLTSSPSLKATTLKSYCYHAMFQNCSSLVTLPKIFGSVSRLNCLSYMFAGCTSLIVSDYKGDDCPDRWYLSVSGSQTNMFTGCAVGSGSREDDDLPVGNNIFYTQLVVY